VVALFNAIAKAKRDTVAQKEQKEGTKDKDNEGGAKSEAAANAILGTSAGSERKEKAGSAGAKTSQAEGGEAGSRGWAALRDDYMLGSELTVKVSALPYALLRLEGNVCMSSHMSSMFYVHSPTPHTQHPTPSRS
jgi:hypothetical protein